MRETIKKNKFSDFKFETEDVTNITRKSPRLDKIIADYIRPKSNVLSPLVIERPAMKGRYFILLTFAFI
jgi:hypothetical protein